MRARYNARQAALRAALQQAFGAGTVLSGGEAGLHLVMWLPEELPDLAVAQRAVQLGLGVRPLSAYARPPVRCNGLVLGYGNLDEGAVEGAVARLRRAVAR
jgi:GntR family transcriptional regulator/MocR family aminotransferase